MTVQTKNNRILYSVSKSFAVKDVANPRLQDVDDFECDELCNGTRKH